MIENKIDQVFADLGKELALIEGRASDIVDRFQVQQREVELLKIESFQYFLVKRRKEIARGRGFGALARDKRRIRDGSWVALGSLVLGGLFTKNRFAALNAGISGFDGYLQGLGETIWFVSFEREILVTPEDSLTAERTWLTWEDLMAAIEKLRKYALKGGRLGDLGNIIAILKSNLRSPLPVWIRKGKHEV